MAMKQILLLAFAFGVALKPTGAIKPHVLAVSEHAGNFSKLDTATIADLRAKLEKAKVLPAEKFSCNNLDFTAMLKKVYGKTGEWMDTHGLNYVCDATPNESPDFSNILYRWQTNTITPNLQFVKQDCQTIIYGSGNVGHCTVVGNHCPECAKPDPAGVLATIHINRNKYEKDGQHIIDCNYVPSCPATAR
eukprot:TRINITY_DN1377_c0_g2_i1.p1 TRINITY_DN1377_c0_g2~~TRINITY_DN1377_c0_g2_i1.p1  ORF type:complete len:191 (+),score=38.72 TRINITY_DN1377_c0_g2_i1:100-672(+)